jgi:hypothetical protein
MWDPDTYQLVKESIIRQQEQEQPLSISGDEAGVGDPAQQEQV